MMHKLSRKGMETATITIIIVIVIGLVIAAIMMYLAKERTSDVAQATSCPEAECTAKQPCQAGYAESFTPCRVKVEVTGEMKIGRCCKQIPE